MGWSVYILPTDPFSVLTMTEKITELIVITYAAYFITVLTGLHFIDKIKDKLMSHDEYELRKSGCSGTGRHNGLKIHRPKKACRFNSGPKHHGLL